MKLLDTTFLIDLHREWSENAPGSAMQYLRMNDREEFLISVVTILEFLEGYADEREGERFLEPFDRVEVTEEIARIGGRTRRKLRQVGTMIGDYDILIAATAIATSSDLVSEDDHMRRVEGLSLVYYRS